MSRCQPRRCLSVVCILIVASLCKAAAPTAKPLVDSVVEPARKESGNIGLVVGVSVQGRTEVFGYGRLAADDDRPPDGATLFEIGSVTKTFTALTLASMGQDNLVRYDDPVQRYLSEKCRVPTRGGKEITLEHLATHVSGLPRIPPELLFVALMSDNPYQRYTPDLMCRFLGNYELPRDIGADWEYSNLGMGLLGCALARRAGVTYEQLVLDRVCRPLGMNDTCIRLSPALQKRMARGHSAEGKPAAAWDFDALAGAGALRSCANDLLRFTAAQLEPPDTPLGTAIRDAQKIRVARTALPGHGQALGWLAFQLEGLNEAYWHNGGTGGQESFVGFRRDVKIAVVVLSNSAGSPHEAATSIGLGLMLKLEERPATSSAPASGSTP